MREQFVDVGLACDFDISITLFDIDAIERIQNAFVKEVDTVFRADDATRSLIASESTQPMAKSST